MDQYINKNTPTMPTVITGPKTQSQHTYKYNSEMLHI